MSIRTTVTSPLISAGPGGARVVLLFAYLSVVSAAGIAAQSSYARAVIDVGLIVSDLDRSVAFYEDALGMQRAYSFDVDGAQARRLGLTDGLEFHAVAFRLGDDQTSPVLKLVRVGSPEVNRPRHIHDQSGIRYLTVFVRALEPMLERLREHDVTVVSEGAVQLRPGQHLVLVQDPDGVFIELIGPMTE
jgi:catechol 2,3-dioxygenase-like lactoylglutathione lyase family enzyme